MNRLIITLLAAFSMLFGIENFIDKNRSAKNELYSTLRPLRPTQLNQINQLTVKASNGRIWHYVKYDSIWRYPGYHEAFVEPKRIEHILNSLINSTASVISIESGDLSRFQLLPSSPVLTLKDHFGSELLAVRLGRGAPDIRSSESYVQLIGQDTIYQLHANAAHAFDASDPPLIDRKIRPSIFGKQMIERVDFGEGFPISQLYRDISQSTNPSVLRATPQIPTYSWFGRFSDGTYECRPENAYAFTAFLNRLTWAQLLNPRVVNDTFTELNTLRLHMSDGNIDTLEIALIDSKTHVGRFRTTGQVFALHPDKTKLLFPTKESLMDSLFNPNLYERVEPLRPF